MTLLQSADGTRIVADTLGTGSTTYVIAHGLTGHRGRSGVRLVTSWFAEHGRVVIFDQRGHGESGGASTLGYREPQDLDAVCTWARELSDGPLVTVGFSLGASVALRHAALAAAPDRVSRRDAEIAVREQPDATVLVSGVGEWYFRGTHIMDRMYRLTSTPWGRVALRAGQGVRVSLRDWSADPGAPVDEIPTQPPACAALVQRPLLLVHGDADHYFPAEHSARVHAAAVASGNRAATLWVEQGMGHAERGTTPELVQRIAQWSAEALSI